MRSEEVEKAINDLMFIVVTDIYGNEIRIDKTKIINEYNGSVGTVLDYIKKLEKLPNKIREKIEELEENRDKYVEENKFGSYMEVEGKIEVLKELLEEEK